MTQALELRFQPKVAEALDGLPTRLTLTVDRARNWLTQYKELDYLFRTNPLVRPFVRGGLTVGEIIRRDDHGEDVESIKSMEFDRTVTSLWALTLILHPNQDEAYMSLTASQKGPNKLLRATYDKFAKKIHELVSSDDGTGNFVRDDKKVALLETGIVIGDLGKSKDFTDSLENIDSFRGRNYIDHDRSLADALTDPGAAAHLAEILPSVARLDENSKQFLTRVIASGFHSPQFQQAEIRPRQAEGLTHLTKEEVDFNWALGTLDIAGAGGNETQKGSVTLTESTVQTTLLALDAMQKIRQHGPIEGTLSFYEKYAERLGWTLETERDLTLTQLACMYRYSQANDANELKRIFKSEYVGEDVRAVWQDELTRTGYEPGGGTMVYYLPSVVTRGTQILMDRGLEKTEAMAAALTLGARLLSVARTAERNSDAVFVLMANDVIGVIEHLIEGDPKRLLNSTISLGEITDHNEAWANVVQNVI